MSVTHDSMPSSVSSSVQFETVRCNLCGQDNYDVVYDSPMSPDAQAHPGDFAASTDRFDSYGRIVRCRGCRLVYTNPRPAPEAVIEGYHRNVDPEYAEEDSSRSINAHLCLSTIQRFAKQGRLLDIGCATGYFLNAARLGFETHGIEPSHWAADYAKQKLRLDVKEGALGPDSFEKGSFDVVSMIDVIEHFTDPASILKVTRDLLKPGGLLYLVTPDIKSLSARLLRGKWWALRPAHLYYFSVPTMKAMLEKEGFEVLLVKDYGRIFSWRYWLSRLKNYPWLMRKPVELGIKLFGVEDKFLYLNTRDSMELVARRK